MLNRFLELVSGDTLSFKIVVKDGASPVDVSLATFTGGIRQPSSFGLIALFDFEVVDAANGVVRAVMGPDKTKFIQNPNMMYEWYVKMEVEEYSKTLCFGGLKVTRL